MMFPSFGNRFGVSAVCRCVSVLTLLLSMFAVGGCDDSDSLSQGRDASLLQPGDTAARTLLVYIMAENNLSGFARSDMNEMMVGLQSMPDNCYLLAFVDDMDKPRLCRLYNDKEGVAQCDTVCMYEDEFCSTDTAEFRKVLDTVLEEYPSESFALVMWSHGTGWLYDAPVSGRSRSIGVDNNIDNGRGIHWMEVEELASVLQSLPVKTEYVLFDACFMNSVEVAYEMRNCTDWIIGSPAEIPANGAPYDKVMASLFSFPFDAKGLIEQYKSGYGYNGVVLSAIKCSEMDGLADATAAVVPAWFSNSSEIDDSDVFSYLRGGFFSHAISYPEYCDMNDAMKLRLPDELYSQWKEVFDNAVPYKTASLRWMSGITGMTYSVDSVRYGGLSMYVPRGDGRYSKFNADFKNTAWYDASGWAGTGR